MSVSHPLPRRKNIQAGENHQEIIEAIRRTSALTGGESFDEIIFVIVCLDEAIAVRAAKKFKKAVLDETDQKPSVTQVIGYLGLNSEFAVVSIIQSTTRGSTDE